MGIRFAMRLTKIDLQRGAVSAVPIFIGYFTASIAFGLLARGTGLSGAQAILFSATSFTGAAQFLALNLIASGAFAAEIVFSFFLVNLRYFLMSASLLTKVRYTRQYQKYLISFGVTDEIFSVAMTDRGDVNTSYMAGLQVTSWSGWVSGTAVGFFAGAVLPASLSSAMQVALFALFTALLVPEIKKEKLIPFASAVSAAALNTVFYFVLKLPSGWALVLSMIITSLAAAAVLTSSSSKNGGSKEAEHTHGKISATGERQ